MPVDANFRPFEPKTWPNEGKCEQCGRQCHDHDEIFANNCAKCLKFLCGQCGYIEGWDEERCIEICATCRRHERGEFTKAELEEQGQQNLFEEKL